MSRFVKPALLVGAPGDVHTSQENRLGQVAETKTGDEYVYLEATANVAIKKFYSYDANNVVTALVSGAIGDVAVAVATFTANASAPKYAWFARTINGIEGDCANTGAAISGVFTVASPAGQVTTTQGTYRIDGVTRTSNSGAAGANTETFNLRRPFVQTAPISLVPASNTTVGVLSANGTAYVTSNVG